MNYLDEDGQFTKPGTSGGTAAPTPTVDNLGGTGATGKALMKAATPAAALTALGTAAITPQTKPADVASGAAAADLVTALNALTALLKTAGVLK